MVVFKRKNRTVSIRLSEDEYATLHRASVATGARSVSDYARDILFSILEPAPVSSNIAEGPLYTRLEKLAGDVEVLTAALHELRGTKSAQTTGQDAAAS